MTWLRGHKQNYLTVFIVNFNNSTFIFWLVNTNRTRGSVKDLESKWRSRWRVVHVIFGMHELCWNANQKRQISRRYIWGMFYHFFICYCVIFFYSYVGTNSTGMLTKFTANNWNVRRNAWKNDWWRSIDP